jgi:surface polysaccharide O-acyltransferase-like enzyme
MTSATLPAAVIQPAKSPKGVARLAWFDVARLFAAYAIVWLHTVHCEALGPWSVLGRFAVPFFAAGSVFFVIDRLRRQPQRGLQEYTINRLRRIYLPFLAWSAIYLLFKLVKFAALPDQPNDFPGIEVLWTGTFWHLWFMPFILVVTWGVFVFSRTIIGRPEREWIGCAIGLLAGAAIAVSPPPAQVAANRGFLLLAWQAMPAVCWGWAFALAISAGAPGLTKIVNHRLTSAAALALFAALVAWLAVFGRNTLVENLSGMVLLVAALQPSAPESISRIGRFGAVAFGIYLSHPLFTKTLEAVAAKLHVATTWQLDLTIFTIAALGSTALSWALAQHRSTRWLSA